MRRDFLFFWQRVLPGLLMITLVGVFICLGTVGCQLNTQEAVPEDPPLKLAGPSENCFGQTLTSLEGYFRGEAEREEIDAAYTCVSGALDMFSTYGRGAADRDSFSSVELRTFLERHFLGSVKLNDSILLELMRVKQALLGGAVDRLTKSEITKLTQVLDTVRVELQRLRPYVNILNQREPKMGQTVDSATLEQALSDFNFSMGTFGVLLGQSKQPYRLENLKTLLLEFQHLYSQRSDWKGPDWVARQMPLIEAAKSVLIRPDGATIALDEWRLLFSHIGRIYGLYLRFTYAIKDRDLFYGDALAQIEIGVREVSEVLEDAIAAKGSDKIDYELLKTLFKALGDTDAFKLPVRASTISDLLESLFERILNPIVVDAVAAQKIDPTDRLSAKGIRAVQGGLTLTNLAQLRDSILSWIEMQQLWERLEKDAVRQNVKLAGKPIPIKMVRTLWATYTPHYKESYSDLKSLLDRPLPMATYPDGRLMMVPTANIVIDRKSFTGLNWKQQVVRTIGYGYISDPIALRMKGITESQLKDAFDDFFNLCIDLGFLDSSDGDIWKTGFTISNIFLPSSDGDDRLSFHEAVDLFVTSFASGVISKSMIRVDVLANCEHLDLNAGGIPKVKAECWRQNFRAGYQKYLSSISNWPARANSWGDDEWGQFFGDMEKAARKPYNKTGPTLMASEMDRVVSIHHYIEALYVRWDSNGDERLSMAEADKAYYLFRTILKEASGFSDDDDVHALYSHLLAFGKPPESWSDKVYWLWWKKHPDEWEKKVSCDRVLLTTIFGNLASHL